MSSKDEIEPFEFYCIEIRLRRNEEWLEQFEKKGFYFSEGFPVADFELPPRFFDMGEKDLDEFKKWFIPTFSRYLGLNKIKASEFCTKSKES